MDTTQDKTAQKDEEAKPLNTVASVAEPKPADEEKTKALGTAHDGELGVNQGSVPDIDPSEALIRKPTASVPAAETKPVTVTQEDVNHISAAEGLMNKLEALAGEIQSLEARIDRLVGGAATPVEPLHTEVKPDSVASAPPEQPKPEEKLPASSTPPAINSPAAPSATVNPAAASIDDIYSSVETTGKNAKKAADDVSEDHSIVGGIGSLLVTLGVILLVLVLVTPFFKEMLGTDLFEMIKAIGWPVIIGLLGIGAVVIFFSMGRIVVKVLAIVFLLIAALMFLGVMGYDSFLGPLRSSLGSIFSFYR